MGIVDYGTRSNLSETWDAFCYREKGGWHEHVSWGRVGAAGRAPCLAREPGAGGHVWREQDEGIQKSRERLLVSPAPARRGRASHVVVFLCRSDLHLPRRVRGRWVLVQRQTPRRARRPRSLLHLLLGERCPPGPSVPAASTRAEGGIGRDREEQRLGPHLGQRAHTQGGFLSRAGAGSSTELPAAPDSHLFQMLLGFANDTEEGLDFFFYLSDASAPKTLFVPLNSGFADNEVSSSCSRARATGCQSPRGEQESTSAGVMVMWNRVWGRRSLGQRDRPAPHPKEPFRSGCSEPSPAALWLCIAVCLVAVERVWAQSRWGCSPQERRAKSWFSHFLPLLPVAVFRH